MHKTPQETNLLILVQKRFITDTDKSEKQIMAEEKLLETPDIILVEIRNLFLEYFDRPWLVNAIEKTRSHYQEMGTIRTFLSVYPREGLQEYHLILTGIRALKDFIRLLRSSILPEASTHLNIYSSNLAQDRELMLLKTCIMYTLPENIKRLDYLTSEFEKTLMRKSLLN